MDSHFGSIKKQKTLRSGEMKRTRRLLPFQERINIIYSLLGVIPYLLVMYIFIYSELELTNNIKWVALAVLVLHFAGFYTMRRISSQAGELSRKTGTVASSSDKDPIWLNYDGPKEFFEITEHFNTLISELTKTNDGYRDVTAQLVDYTKKIEDYQKQLRDEAILREKLGRYVGHNVVDQIVKSGSGMPLKNEKADVTVLFADIRLFTTLSEKMAPGEVITLLNEYFDRMVSIIFRYNGILDKFIGDGLMAVFGVLSKEDHVSDAVKAALQMQRSTREMMEARKAQGKPTFTIGIGINSGEVIIGNVGTHNRIDYTVIGDAVNVASRLETKAQDQIIVGEEIFRRVGRDFTMSELGEIRVRNRQAPVRCYQIQE